MQTDILLKSDMKKLYTLNHKLYEQYYLDQAKQKGGNLPAFHGARSPHGYGQGDVFRGLFRWAMPHLRQGAKVLAKKALQTGVNVAQDVIEGKDIKVAVSKRAKQALGDFTSQNSPQEQSGGGRKAIKKKSHCHSSARSKRRKITPRRQGQENFELWP